MQVRQQKNDTTSTIRASEGLPEHCGFFRILYFAPFRPLIRPLHHAATTTTGMVSPLHESFFQNEDLTPAFRICTTPLLAFLPSHLHSPCLTNLRERTNRQPRRQLHTLRDADLYFDFSPCNIRKPWCGRGPSIRARVQAYDRCSQSGGSLPDSGDGSMRRDS